MNPSISFSPIIVGTMRLGVWGVNMNTNELQQFVEDCLALGLNDFDHADIYGHYTTEADFGKVLKGQSSLRDKIQITTKCGIKLTTENRPSHRIKSYNSSAAHILQNVDNSLRALETDYIDVLLLHRPDYLMNPQEIAEAFEQLKQAGKVKHFGVSNFSPSQFDLLNSFTPLVTNQVEISLLHRNTFEDGTLDQCLKLGITPTAWSPMGGGLLFSKTPDETTKRIHSVAQPICEKYNITLDQLLFAWLYKHPSGIIPVVGTSKIERIKAAKVAKDIVITHEEWYDLWQAAIGKEVA